MYYGGETTLHALTTLVPVFLLEDYIAQVFFLFFVVFLLFCFFGPLRLTRGVYIQA